MRLKHVPDKPNTPNSCKLDWSVQRRALDCKRWTSLLLAVKWGLRLHTAGEVWCLRLPWLFMLLAFIFYLFLCLPIAGWMTAGWLHVHRDQLRDKLSVTNMGSLPWLITWRMRLLSLLSACSHFATSVGGSVRPRHFDVELYSDRLSTAAVWNVTHVVKK